MPVRQTARLYSARTRQEFLRHVRSYVTAKDLSLTKLSARALGNPNTLSRAVNSPTYRLTLADVDATFSYMERHP